MSESNDDGIDAVDIRNFRNSLVKFEHIEPSFRKHTPSSTIANQHQAISVRSSKRRSPSSSAFDPHDQLEREAQVRSKTSQKKKRKGYASPDTYAHLHSLQDYVAEDLDVLFCGINPGYRSAEVGHHFANPTNHFWKCLHMSGFTPRLLRPSEDFSLPDFGLGLTNLVDRPSVQQAELSRAEMVAAVPAFLAKLKRFRPRIVCLVGLCIWHVVHQALLQSISFTLSHDESVSSPQSRNVGLQSIKLLYTESRESGISEAPIKETLFFAVPSTSGRVVSHQLADKILIFSTLKDVLEAVKQRELRTDEMVVVGVDSLPSSS